MSTPKSPKEMLEEATVEELRAARVVWELARERKRQLLEGVSSVPASNAESVADPRYVKWLLPDAVVAFLVDSEEPQAVKQIAAVFKRAGRPFDAVDPEHAVRGALKKAMAKNDDVFHVGSAKYHLRSKYRGKTKKLEKLMAKANGRGGQTSKDHGRSTSDGIAKRRAKDPHWGPTKKMTPEAIERAKTMLRNGVTLTEVCKTLKVSTATIYGAGIHQRALKKEGQQLKELPLEENSNVVRLKG